MKNLTFLQIVINFVIHPRNRGKKLWFQLLTIKFQLFHIPTVQSKPKSPINAPPERHMLHNMGKGQVRNVRVSSVNARDPIEMVIKWSFRSRKWEFCTEYWRRSCRLGNFCDWAWPLLGSPLSLKCTKKCRCQWILWFLGIFECC